MGLLGDLLFKKEDPTTVKVVCPVCEMLSFRPRAYLSAELQRPAPAFVCNGCSADITAAVLKIPVVAEMASALETARIQNSAAKESLEELREPGRKEEEARQEQSALVKLGEDYAALQHKVIGYEADHVKVLKDNSDLRQQNAQLRSGMEAAAAHVRLAKAQLDAVPEPSISFFVQVGDPATSTRVKCTGCTTELVLRCPKCGYYQVLTVEMRGKDKEIVLMRRLESHAHPAKRDPVSALMLVD